MNVYEKFPLGFRCCSAEVKRLHRLLPSLLSHIMHSDHTDMYTEAALLLGLILTFKQQCTYSTVNVNRMHSHSVSPLLFFLFFQLPLQASVPGETKPKSRPKTKKTSAFTESQELWYILLNRVNNMNLNSVHICLLCTDIRTQDKCGRG